MEVVGLVVLHGLLKQSWENSEDSAWFCSRDNIVDEIRFSSELIKVTENQQFGLKLDEGLILEHTGSDEQELKFLKFIHFQDLDFILLIQ
jgi:hypothetical protein